VDATPVAPPVARTPAVAAPVVPLGPVAEAAAEKSPPADSILNKTLATEVIRERNPNGTVKIERHVTLTSDGNYSNNGVGAVDVPFDLDRTVGIAFANHFGGQGFIED